MFPVEARRCDQLIFNQESLLNSYRCLFNVDTQIVPGGCPASAPQAYQMPVWYCVPEGRQTLADVEAMTAEFNRRISPFWARESSGQANVQFTVGGLLHPPAGTDWATERVIDVYRGNGTPGECLWEARHGNWEAGIPGWIDRVLMIADLDSPAEVSGTDDLHGIAVVRLDAWGGPGFEAFYTAVAHETGHALFAFEHTGVDGSECVDYSLMNTGGLQDCGGSVLTEHTPLARQFIVCFQRESAGWPC